MDITVLQNLAANNLWGAITPEIMLGVLALALLVALLQAVRLTLSARKAPSCLSPVLAVL